MKTKMLALSLVTLAALTTACSSGAIDGGATEGAGGQGSVTSTATGAGSSGTTSGFTTSASATSSGTGAGSCDGADLEGCACDQDQSSRACFQGDPQKMGVGACAMGKQVCQQTDGGGELTMLTWGPCVGSSTPAPEVCGDNVDNDCNGVVDDNCASCIEGTTQECLDGNNQKGTQSCVNGMWQPCVITTTGSVGGPCTPGDATKPGQGDPGCSLVDQILYCDDTQQWQCFPSGDCEEGACTSCMQANCANLLGSSPDAACNAALATAWKWLEECGPDRTQYFADLNAVCPNSEVWTLNSCKFQYCLSGNNGMGPCNFW